jgi:hypothetical protein
MHTQKAIEEDKIDYVVMATEGALAGLFFFVNAGSVVDIEVPTHTQMELPIKNQTIGFTTRLEKDKKT